jgi:hypothetical protein
MKSIGLLACRSPIRYMRDLGRLKLDADELLMMTQSK